MQNSNNIIEEILNEKRGDLGNHFDKYRNHVYRVFTFCKKLDTTKGNEDKYAIASAFHDLGIWTNDTFDYLEPSIDLAKEYLKRNNKEEWKEEISLMIDMHHKRNKYKGLNEKTIETFRCADWIDVSLGIISFGLDKNEYKKISKTFPIAGFHGFLIIQFFKNLFKNPLNPLPMFKK